MAEVIGKAASLAADNISAENLVYGEKPSLGGSLDVLETKGDGDSGGSGSSVKQKEFYWDQILFYLVSAILGLSFLDISVEFFRGSAIQCFTPDDITNRDQTAYLNNYCYTSLPNTQYYLIFILISALVIIAPHYLWTSYFGAHFDYFFDLVKKLHRLREPKTGQYHSLNVEVVKKLEQKFSTSNTLVFRFYKFKLLGQLLITIVVLLINAVYFKDRQFQETFLCPTDNITTNTLEWPLPNRITCVYNSLKLLSFLHRTAFGLISAAILVIIVGLVWCFIRHPTELGAKEIATFCNISCLSPEEFVYPSLRLICKGILYCRRDKHLKQRKEKEAEDQTDNPQEDDYEKDKEEGKCCCLCFRGFIQSTRRLFKPRIQNDLDFLLMMLYYADSGHGQVFKDIQIYKELKQKGSQDHESLHLLNRVHADYRDLQIDLRKQARRYRRQQQADDASSSTQPIDPAPDDWDRIKDLRKYYYESGFEKAGPGRNPDDRILSLFKKKMGIKSSDWTVSAFRNVLYSYFSEAPNNKFALDISFGTSIGYPLILARGFLSVLSINFNPFYKNETNTYQQDNYQTNYRSIVYPEDMYSKNAKTITKSEQPIINIFNENNGRQIDMIFVGPMTSRSKIFTANLFIEKLYSQKWFFRRNSKLIAVRPLKIGSKSRTNHFVEYLPPEGIFKDINEEVELKLHDHGVLVYSVDDKGTVRRVDREEALPVPSGPLMRHQSTTTSLPSGLQRRGTINRIVSMVFPEKTPPPRGIVVNCGDVECIFEFKVYEYCGRYTGEEEEESNDTVGDNQQPTAVGNNDNDVN